MRLLVVGDSHVVALSDAFDADPEGYRRQFGGEVAPARLLTFPVLLEPFFRQEGDGLHLTNRRAGTLLLACSGQAAFRPLFGTVYALSMAFTTTILMRLSFWRQFLPWAHCTEAAQPISDAVLRNIAEAHFRHILDFAAAARELGIALLMVEAPPLRRGELAMHSHFPEAAFLAVDRVARDLIRQRLAALGIPVVAVPEAVRDPAGFLLPEFCRFAPRDHHHGNAAFGACMLSAVIAAARTLLEQQACAAD
jgi:hypothetical protein